MGNIVGLDLTLDKDYLAEAVKQTVIIAISESLNGKNEITSQIVKSVLSTRVSDKGTISSYERDNKYTLLEYYVSVAIRELAKEELQSVINDRREEMRSMIRNELSKKANLNKFVDTFISNTVEVLDSSWRTNIDISFAAKKE